MRSLQSVANWHSIGKRMQDKISEVGLKYGKGRESFLQENTTYATPSDSVAPNNEELPVVCLVKV